MKDTIIKGNGKAYAIKAPADVPATWEDFRLLLLAGTAHLDITLNTTTGDSAGCDEVGTALNKANLLPDTAAAWLKLAQENPSVADAFMATSGKSTIVTATLLAASWVGTAAPYTYTLTVSGVTATSNQELLPALDITADQLEALQGANITDGGQAASSITLKAWGDVPTVDIPIRIIKRGDM